MTTARIFFCRVQILRISSEGSQTAVDLSSRAQQVCGPTGSLRYACAGLQRVLAPTSARGSHQESCADAGARFLLCARLVPICHSCVTDEHCTLEIFWSLERLKTSQYRRLVSRSVGWRSRPKPSPAVGRFRFSLWYSECSCGRKISDN